MYPVPPAELHPPTSRLIIPVMHIISWLLVPSEALQAGPWGQCDQAIEHARDPCVELDHDDSEHGPPGAVGPSRHGS